MTDPADFRLRVLHEGWNTFGIATLKTPNGGTVDRAFEHHGAAAAVMPYDPERRCALLVRQDRVGVLYWGETEQIAEVPAGGLDEKSPEATAVEEALEEAGVRLTSLELIVEAYAMPSVSSERIWLYLAPYSEGDRVSEGGGIVADGERLTVEEVGLDELARLAAVGQLRDMKTLLLLQALQLRRPELFGV
ncbi:NUDIX domain-containing protein [Methylobacterium sp. SyP6R]|uniref:NUDIX domain-containing protein n=1 Tax=Methylobacterium sp. SyP6R TaxID=2718876 RepID=UPI001F198D4D|nr:NUDIX domain-containing protein [Methylobacterium sp. SyP6R]MCF4130226.1 NUDIX domain-containing protein [Methylobacterium sp. SyP6R]